MRKYLDLKANIAIGLIIAFLLNSLGPFPLAQAQEFLLPRPGTMVLLSSEFNPPILKGIKVHPENPFKFDFILDRGDAGNRHPERSEGSQQELLKTESTKLIKYFLASLTIPEKDLWVNLSPYEKDRIVPESFGQTEMGRDLLAEDYMLKQITASLIYPEGEIGKKFWKRIYEEAAKKFGTTNIPVNTFNKVWIVPEKAVVYENPKAGTAYIVESKLKVMLEEDYLSLEKHQKSTVILSAAKDLNKINSIRDSSATPQNDVNILGSQILREIVIPELTGEVNYDKNFAQLRQVYNSLILATWYKKKMRESILAQFYEDKKKIKGLSYPIYKNMSSSNALIGDPQHIYQQYLKAFKKGAYNYIKEDLDPVTQNTVPRKYFSGGCSLLAMSKTEEFVRFSKSNMIPSIRRGDFLKLSVNILNAGYTNIKKLVLKQFSRNPKVIQNIHDQAMRIAIDTFPTDIEGVSEKSIPRTLEEYFLEEGLLKIDRKITEEDIKKIHWYAAKNQPNVLNNWILSPWGEYRRGYIKTIARTFPKPEELGSAMEEFVTWLNHQEIMNEGPAVLAARVYIKFIRIHPFSNGNGRVGRELINLILRRHGASNIQDMTRIDWRRLSQYDQNVNYLASVILAALRTEAAIDNSAKWDMAMQALDQQKAGAFRFESMLSQALPTIEVLDSNANGYAYKKVIEVMAQVGRYKEARLFIENHGIIGLQKSNWLVFLATFLVQLGEYKEAQETVNTIDNVYQKSSALVSLAKAMMEAKQDPTDILKEAYSTIESIGTNKEYYKCEVLISLGEAKTQAGQDASGVLKEALLLVRGVRDYHKPDLLISLGEAMDQAGQDPKPIFDEAGSAIRSNADTHDTFLWSNRLLSSRFQARARVLVRQRKYEVARNIYRYSEDWYFKSRSLISLVGFLTEVGRFKDAKLVAETIKYDQDKAKAMSLLTEALIQAGQYQQAHLVIEDIKRVRKADELETAKSRELYSLANAMLKAGENPIQIESEMDQLAKDYRNERERYSYWGSNFLMASLAKIKVHKGELYAATRYIDMIQKDNFMKIDALSYMAKAMAEKGIDPHEVFEKAYHLISGIRNSVDKVNSLTSLAKAMAEVYKFLPDDFDFPELYQDLLSLQKARNLVEVALRNPGLSQRWHHDIVQAREDGWLSPFQFNQYMASLAFRLNTSGILPSSFGGMLIRWLGYLPEALPASSGRQAPILHLRALKLEYPETPTESVIMNGVHLARLAYETPWHAGEYPDAFRSYWVFDQAHRKQFRVHGHAFIGLGLSLDGSAALYQDVNTAVIFIICVNVPRTQREYSEFIQDGLEQIYKQYGVYGVRNFIVKMSSHSEEERVMRIVRGWISTKQDFPIEEEKELLAPIDTMDKVLFGASNKSPMEVVGERIKALEVDDISDYRRFFYPSQSPLQLPRAISDQYVAALGVFITESGSEWLGKILHCEAQNAIAELGGRQVLFQNRMVLDPHPIRRILYTLGLGVGLHHPELNVSHLEALIKSITPALERMNIDTEDYHLTVKIGQETLPLQDSDIGKPISTFLAEHSIAEGKGVYIGNEFIPRELLGEFTVLPGDEYRVKFDVAKDIDSAMKITPQELKHHELLPGAIRRGGIDLTPANRVLQTQNAGEGIKFHLDQAQFAQLQNSDGLMVGEVSIQALKSLPEFLGIN